MVKKKVQTRWPESAIRTMLAFIDENKGKHSKMMNDLDQALADIVDSLLPNATEVEANALSPQSLLNKIRDVWRRYKLPEHAGLNSFWLHGTGALDPEKLPAALRAVQSVQHEPESQQESPPTGQTVSASVAPPLGPGTSSSTASITSSPKRRRSQHVSDDLDPGSPTKRLRKRDDEAGEVQGEQPRDSSSTSSSSSSEEEEEKDYFGVEAAIDEMMEKRKDPLYRNPITTYEELKERIRRSRSPSASPVRERDPKQLAALDSISCLGRLVAGNNDEYERLWRAEAYNAPLSLIASPRNIAQELGILHSRVQSCVGPLFEALGIPCRQPIFLDHKLILPAELRVLLARLLGCHVNQLTDEMMGSFFATQAEQHIDLSTFIQSLLALYVMEHCLRPSPQSTDTLATFGDRSITTGIARVLGPRAEAHIMHSILQTHIRDFVRPRLASKAGFLASKFDQFLKFLLPTYAHPLDDYRVLYDIETITPAANQPDDFGASRGGPQSDWQMQWMRDLRQCFEDALRWKCTHAMTGNEDFSFIFPSYRDEYVRRGLGDRLRTSEKAPKIVADEGHVLITLMPTVERRTRANLTAIWGPWQRVFDGVVVVESGGRGAGEAAQNA